MISSNITLPVTTALLLTFESTIIYQVDDVNLHVTQLSFFYIYIFLLGSYKNIYIFHCYKRGKVYFHIPRKTLPKRSYPLHSCLRKITMKCASSSAGQCIPPMDVGGRCWNIVDKLRKTQFFSVFSLSTSSDSFLSPDLRSNEAWSFFFTVSRGCFCIVCTSLCSSPPWTLKYQGEIRIKQGEKCSRSIPPNFLDTLWWRLKGQMVIWGHNVRKYVFQAPSCCEGNILGRVFSIKMHDNGTM